MSAMNDQPQLFRKPWETRLIEDLVIFQAKSGLKFTTIGRKAIKNPRLWERLCSGGTITVEKADQVYAWMASQGAYFNS